MRKISILLLALIFVSILGCAGNRIAFAAEATVYTDVLEDLQKDETFDVAAFPLIENDYSLQVIQVAESNNKELFVYVYQPGGSLVTATEIRISQTIKENLSPKDYSLKLLSSNSTLFKYLVEDLTVKDDVVRYYSIMQISRPYDEVGDVEFADDPSVVTIPYSVSKLYTACTVHGEVSYSSSFEYTIEIKDKYCGYLRYYNGFKLYYSSCDSHFVAFSTYEDIDTLFEAQVSFVSQDNHFSRNGIGIADTWADDPVKQSVTLSYTDKVSNPGDGLFGYKYTWDRIESVSDFIANEDLTDECVENLQSMQWVLRFYESDYEYFESGSSGALKNWTTVNEVTILRLKFERGGHVFNLGVIDNKQNEDPIQGNEDLNSIEAALKNLQKMFADFTGSITSFFDSLSGFFEEYWWVIALVVGLLVLGILCAVAKPVLVVVKWVLIVLWYIITAPIQLIVLIVRKAKERKYR